MKVLVQFFADQMEANKVGLKVNLSTTEEEKEK